MVRGESLASRASSDKIAGLFTDQLHSGGARYVVHSFEVVIGVRHHHGDNVVLATVTSAFLEHWNQSRKILPIFMDLIKDQQSRSARPVRLFLPDGPNDARADAVG